MKIIADGLIKQYKGRRVVSGVSFEVNQGEIVGLLGPNGAGKTTTFYMITGLVKPNGGSVKFDERTVTKWPMFRRAREGVGYLPQETSVFRRLSVEDNIRLVMEMNHKSGKEIRETTDRLCEEFHIERIRKSMAGVLSGGERRRVEIARALAIEPKFLLLDEPFTGIDPKTIEELQQILFQLKRRNIGILITDHNVAATLKITDRNNILIDGQIVARGVAAEIVRDPDVRKHYLGQDFAPEELVEDVLETVEVNQDKSEEEA